jgi:hypothetical protein
VAKRLGPAGPAIVFAVSLILAGCSAGAESLPPGPATAVGATSDVNPQNPATLRIGGDLRLALTEFPSNFNTLHIDGNSADVGGMLKATMPRAFVIGPDGSTTVDTDYFSSVELTDQRGGQKLRDRRHQRQRTGQVGDPGRRRPPGRNDLRQAIRRVARHVRR